MTTAVHGLSPGALGPMFAEPGQGAASCECAAALLRFIGETEGGRRSAVFGELELPLGKEEG